MKLQPELLRTLGLTVVLPGAMAVTILQEVGQHLCALMDERFAYARLPSGCILRDAHSQFGSTGDGYGVLPG